MIETIKKVSLAEFFKFSSPTHILGTTYTISTMFFESVVWPLIDKSRLERCLLLCDKAGFKRASFEAIGLKDASISYMVIPVPTERTFHPKVWLMANQKHVSLLVGSGNLTQSGFMDNNELFDVVTFEKATIEPLFFEDICSFICGLRDFFSYNCESNSWVCNTLTQILDLLQIESKYSEKDWSVRFLHSFQKPFYKQLGEVARESELFVAS